MRLRDEYRTVIVRDEDARWWRRYRWAVERRFGPGRPWDLRATGHAATAKDALRKANTSLFFSSSEPPVRVEALVAMQDPERKVEPPKPSPLNAELLPESPHPETGAVGA